MKKLFEKLIKSVNKLRNNKDIIDIHSMTNAKFFRYYKENNTSKDTLIEVIKRSVYLRNTNLGGWDFSNVDLSGVNLSGVNLYGVNLSYTNLSNADLSNADLGYTNLSNANLSNAKLSNTNLYCANLSNADLSNADLFCTHLYGANLSNANLSYSHIDRVNFSYANLRNAKFCNAFLHNSDLSYSNLSGVELCETDVCNLYLLYANLYHTDLRGVNLNDIRFYGAHLNGIEIIDDGILFVGNIGSGRGNTILYNTKKGIYVNCSFFCGTIDEFIEKVKEFHNANKHERNNLEMHEFDMEYWNTVYRFSKEKFINDLKHQLIYKGSLENI